jgi:hypothetical protein
MTRFQKVRCVALAVILGGAYMVFKPNEVRATAATCWSTVCGDAGCNGPPPSLVFECGMWNVPVGCNPYVTCDGGQGSVYWCDHEI